MPKLLTACLAVAGIASTLSLSADGNDTQATPCLVTTDRSDAGGADFAPSCAFLGVPYATPHGRCQPMEATREPRAPWAPAVVNATTASPQCAQVQQPSGTAMGVEDCLFMNIWTREVTLDEPAPVLVWFRAGHRFTGRMNRVRRHQRQATRRGARHRRGRAELPGSGSLGFLAHGAPATEDPAHPT